MAGGRKIRTPGSAGAKRRSTRLRSAARRRRIILPYGSDSLDATRSGRLWTRREFFRIAGLGALGLTAGGLILPAWASSLSGPGSVQGLTPCDDLVTLRAHIAQAEHDLKQVFHSFEAAGLPLHNPAPPMTPSQVTTLTDQATDIVQQLANHLRPYPRETLEQLYPPWLAPVVQMSRMSNTALIASPAEISNMFVQPNVSAVECKSLGYVCFTILMGGLFALDAVQIDKIMTSGLIEGLIEILEEIVRALTKGQWKALKKALVKFMEALAKLVLKLGQLLGKKIMEKIAKLATTTWIAIAIAAIQVGKAIYDNWDKIKEHL